MQKKRQKTRFMCYFNGNPSFSLTQRAITQRSVITLGPIFTKKNGLKLNARLEKKKSRSFSAKKMSTSGDITKNVEGWPDSAPPALLGLNIVQIF